MAAIMDAARHSSQAHYLEIREKVCRAGFLVDVCHFCVSKCHRTISFAVLHARNTLPEDIRNEILV